MQHHRMLDAHAQSFHRVAKRSTPTVVDDCCRSLPASSKNFSGVRSRFGIDRVENGLDHENVNSSSRDPDTVRLVGPICVVTCAAAHLASSTATVLNSCTISCDVDSRWVIAVPMNVSILRRV